MPKLSSKDHVNAIIADYSTQTTLIDMSYAARIKDPVGFARIWGPDRNSFVAKCRSKMTESDKSWRRWWRRKDKNGFIERCFMIDGLYDFMVITREKNGVISVIEYYYDSMDKPALDSDAMHLLPGSIPYLVSNPPQTP